MRMKYKLLLGIALVVAFKGYEYCYRYNYSGYSREQGLEPLIEEPQGSFPADSVVQLHFEDGNFCSGVIIGKNYAITAAHCLVDAYGELVVSNIVVKGQKVNNAKAAGFYRRTDIGLIKGDFSNEGAVHMENNDFGMLTANLFACGYPLGNTKLYCETVRPSAIDGFFIRAIGIAIPGMSGGAVFRQDETGVRLVGLISGAWSLADGSGLALAHTTGLLGFFGIEP